MHNKAGRLTDTNRRQHPSISSNDLAETASLKDENYRMKMQKAFKSERRHHQAEETSTAAALAVQKKNQLNDEASLKGLSVMFYSFRWRCRGLLVNLYIQLQDCKVWSTEG